MRHTYERLMLQPETAVKPRLLVHQHEIRCAQPQMTSFITGWHIYSSTKCQLTDDARRNCCFQKKKERKNIQIRQSPTEVLANELFFFWGGHKPKLYFIHVQLRGKNASTQS